MNRLLRTTGPLTCRLIFLAEQDHPIHMHRGRSLKQDIRALEYDAWTPVYSVFIRPKTKQLSDAGIIAA